MLLEIDEAGSVGWAGRGKGDTPVSCQNHVNQSIHCHVPTAELEAKGTFCPSSPCKAVPWMGRRCWDGLSPTWCLANLRKDLGVPSHLLSLLDMLNWLTLGGFSSQAVSDSCALLYASPCPMGHGLIQAVDGSPQCCHSLPRWCRMHPAKLLPLPRYLPFPIFSPLTHDRKQHPAVPGPELPWNNLLGLINISASVLFNKYLL